MKTPILILLMQLTCLCAISQDTTDSLYQAEKNRIQRLATRKIERQIDVISDNCTNAFLYLVMYRDSRQHHAMIIDGPNTELVAKLRSTQTFDTLAVDWNKIDRAHKEVVIIQPFMAACRDARIYDLMVPVDPLITLNFGGKN